MTSSEASCMFFIYLFGTLVLNYGYSEREQGGREYVIIEGGAGHIPPKPNHSLTLTAIPDPFEAEDPTTQAKLILRRDLFSDDNGKVVYYALLVAREGFTELPTSGSWNSKTGWPIIQNWEWENTSYQVTKAWWDPFSSSPFASVSYTLGDGRCDANKTFCNPPLKENTKYTLKVRGFTDSGYQDTEIIYFRTLDKLPVCKIASLLGGFLLLTSIGVCLSLINFGCLKKARLFPGRKTRDSFSPIQEALSHKSFLKYAKDLLNTPGRLGNEFHLLGTLSSDVSTLSLHAQRVDNRAKNRYGNILPFDMTRVKLSIIDDDPSTDYINASFIRGFKLEPRYIASQGPKEETCHDFYRMIIEQNIELIVMVTDLTERGVEKCFKYYPENNEIIKFKDITVSCTQNEDFGMCTKRVFGVSTIGRYLTVTHLHLKNWRDFECPDNTDIMLKFCDVVRKHLTKGYILVHCSAGAGRTGTFIAVDILLQEIKNNNRISVFNTVLKLRQQRVNMVSTEAQLGYVYRCAYKAIEDASQGPRKSSDG